MTWELLDYYRIGTIMAMAYDAVAYVWELIGWIAAACFWGIVGYIAWLFWKGGK